MKRIDATFGYREEYENGEIRYYSDWTGQGYAYKDETAFNEKRGVAYIREATFAQAREDYGRDYVTLEQLEQEDDCTTYKKMYEWARKYFKTDIPNGYPYVDEFLAAVCRVCFEIVDWQGFDMIIDEMDWDYLDNPKSEKPLPWNWKVA